MKPITENCPNFCEINRWNTRKARIFINDFNLVISTVHEPLANKFL